VNLVVPDDGKFNLAGASRPGIYSGKALRTPFTHYSDQLASATGPIDIPHVMGQDRYAWILRPPYAPPV